MTKISLFKNSKDTSTYKAGDVIFNTGQSGDRMYVVVEGEVDIKLGDRVVQTLVEEEFFGEMGIIDNSPRSATAVAKTDCRLAEIDQRKFTFLVQQTPFFALQVMKGMADRLRAANSVGVTQ